MSNSSPEEAVSLEVAEAIIKKADRWYWSCHEKDDTTPIDRLLVYLDDLFKND